MTETRPRTKQEVKKWEFSGAHATRPSSRHLTILADAPKVCLAGLSCSCSASSSVLILQASYGPKRLTIHESQKLTDDLAAMTLERQQLQSSLREVERTLTTEREQFTQKIATLESNINKLNSRLKPLHDEVSLFTKALSANMKFDPVGIGAAAFTQSRDQDSLKYHIMLLQENDKKPEYAGRIEVTFEGRYPNGRSGAVVALVLPFNLGHYEHLIGSVDLPKGFRATRGTLRVYKADGQKALAYRTFPVES
jgi:chaperonin cofactor prefoldin